MVLPNAWLRTSCAKSEEWIWIYNNNHLIKYLPLDSKLFARFTYVGAARAFSTNSFCRNSLIQMIRCSTFEQRIGLPAHVHSKLNCFRSGRSFPLLHGTLSRFSSAHIAATECRTKSEASEKNAQHTRVKISSYYTGNDKAKFLDRLQSAHRAVDMLSLLCCFRFPAMILQMKTKPKIVPTKATSRIRFQQKFRVKRCDC